MRVFLGLKGKNGLPKINYKNGKMYSGDKGMVVQSQNIEGDPESGLTIKLNSSKRYTPIKFYKALCKIALSVVEDDQLPDLEGTIEWLKCEDLKSEVPRVAVNVINSGFTKVPIISLYTRKSDSTHLPHVVGEFKIGNFIYVFIIPFSKRDTLSFVDKKAYQGFWSSFKHYHLVTGWRYDNFNSHKEVIMNETIKLVRNEPVANK